MDNPRFDTFREMLRSRGVELRALWEAKRNPDSRYSDTFGFAVIGEARPAVGTLVVVDYGAGKGFGLYVDTESNNMEADVARIVGEGC